MAVAPNNVREVRERRGWTLADMSGLTGKTVSYLSLVERGLREPPPATKVTIARALGERVGELFPVTREAAVA